MPDEAESPQVRPIRPSPAETAALILKEEVEQRDIATALPRIAAELARANALTVETIRLQQLQIGLIQDTLRAIVAGQAAGVDLQSKLLDTFAGIFGPLAGLMVTEGNRAPALPPVQPAVPPAENISAGVRVTQDAPEE